LEEIYLPWPKVGLLVVAALVVMLVDVGHHNCIHTVPGVIGSIPTTQPGTISHLKHTNKMLKIIMLTTL